MTFPNAGARHRWGDQHAGNRTAACFGSRRVHDLLMVTGRLLAAFVTVALVGIARFDEQGARAGGTASPSPAARYQANNFTPSWSPDGKRIAYVRLHAGSPDVYLMNADGSHPAQSDAKRVG